MRALPPGKNDDDKFYLGFFERDRLAALMDFICAYPCENAVFIGLFMVDAALQGQGVGSKIIQECCSYWKDLQFRKVQLGVDKENPQSNAFWKKTDF